LSGEIDLFVRGEVHVQSGYYGYIDDSAYGRVPGAAVADLGMGAKIRDFEISIWVDNISDARTFTGIYPASTGSAGYFAGPGLPRLWGLTLRSSVGG
jgi:outer membrane receptor protein involved in Fe transport